MSIHEGWALFLDAAEALGGGLVDDFLAAVGIGCIVRGRRRGSEGENRESFNFRFVKSLIRHVEPTVVHGPFWENGGDREDNEWQGRRARSRAYRQDQSGIWRGLIRKNREYTPERLDFAANERIS